MHEDPQVPNYGRPGSGMLIEAGMCFAIEPMFNLGTDDVYVEDDGWTVRTADGARSAHFENTIAVTADGPDVLTVRP
jgi:methionyl aminopeptidase